MARKIAKKKVSKLSPSTHKVFMLPTTLERAIKKAALKQGFTGCTFAVIAAT